MNKLLFLILLFPILVFAQDMKLKNPDKETNFNLMKSGKFVQEINHPKVVKGYFMVIKDSIKYEYSESGKYVVKSRIIYLKPDTFQSIAYETNLPGFECHMSEIVETKILKTSTKDSLIRTKERINKGKWHDFVMRKVID